ncbi:unnamed protein product [Rhizoctonia solani]|uniref:Uncharacterized protein n=1 Tax=Rhizoctonia solani TaxID=456999 RepID=A0A8H3GVF6_9AGAM|nr:unnamed protein product [Rhizoctonia solani]
MSRPPSRAGTPSGRASPKLSTVATLVSLLTPPSSNSTLDLLIKDVQEIIELTRASKRQELLEFGEYVDRMVRQLGMALQNERLAKQPSVMKNLEELQKTLHQISGQIVSIKASGGLFSRTRYILLPEEDHISRMRQQLNDALSAFQFSALVELLARSPNPPSGGAAAGSEPNLPQTRDPSYPPTRDHPRTTRRQPPQPIQLVQDGRSPSPRSDTNPSTRGARPPLTSATITRTSGPEDGEILAAVMNVERCRHSLQHNCAPNKKLELAAALDRLTGLLAKAGRTGEALSSSQEAAELYKYIAEGVH